MTRKTDSQDTQEVAASQKSDLAEDPQDLVNPALPMKDVEAALSKSGLDEHGEPDEDALASLAVGATVKMER